MPDRLACGSPPVVDSLSPRRSDLHEMRRSTRFKLVCLLGAGCLAASTCGEQADLSSLDPVNWSARAAVLPSDDSLAAARTYLPVYSHIYSRTERIDHNLTVTASLRNVSAGDTLYLLSADYYDTGGSLIRSYFADPIYVAPLETVEIVIDALDRAGGSGANFLFDWRIRAGAPEPLFEAVMISTNAQQGLSFTTRGVRT